MSVDYGDGTKAIYHYSQAISYPEISLGFIFLDHALDPRLEGFAVNMKFTYDHSTASGFIKEERNGRTGEVMATLHGDDSNRWVCYPNGRVQYLNMPEEFFGDVQEYTDGLGRKSRYTYNEVGFGFPETSTDALGRVTVYNRRTIYGNQPDTTHPDGSNEQGSRLPGKVYCTIRMWRRCN